MTWTQHISYESLKKLTWACDRLKLVICQRITSKITRPRWVDTWARGTVMWYWSADTLFWQLSIDHNIDVQLVFSWAPKLAKSVRVNIGFPVVRTDGGRSVYGHVITKFSGMGRFTYPWCSAGALRAPELRYNLRVCWLKGFHVPFAYAQFDLFYHVRLLNQ